MSKKHFIYAANQVAYYCLTNNTAVSNSELYLSYCSLFQTFNDKFNQEKFYDYINVLVSEHKEDVMASVEN